MQQKGGSSFFFRSLPSGGKILCQGNCENDLVDCPSCNKGGKDLLSQRSYETFFFSSADRKRTLRVLYRYEMPGIGGVENGFLGLLGVQCYDQAFGQE